MGGEITTCSEGELSWINSSNEITISLKLNSVERFAGTSERIFGGASSFGPPVGATCWAQPKSSKIEIEKSAFLI